MNKETIKRWEVYAKQLEDRVNSPVPEKHKDRPVQFKEYLNNELAMTRKKIENAKLFIGK